MMMRTAFGTLILLQGLTMACCRRPGFISRMSTYQRVSGTRSMDRDHRVVPKSDCLVYVFVIECHQTTPIAMHTHSPDLSSQALVAHTQLLLDSFERVVGRSLMPRTGNPQEEVGVLDLCISNQSLLHDTNVGHGWRVFFFFGCALKASRMFNLPDRVVLSHGTQEDPVLNYANALGLKLWEMDWERLTSTPSRKYVSTSAS